MSNLIPVVATQSCSNVFTHLWSKKMSLSRTVRPHSTPPVYTRTLVNNRSSKELVFSRTSTSKICCLFEFPCFLIVGQTARISGSVPSDHLAKMDHGLAPLCFATTIFEGAMDKSILPGISILQDRKLCAQLCPPFALYEGALTPVLVSVCASVPACRYCVCLRVVVKTRDG